MESYLEKIGRLIQESRTMRGLTQTQLAEALGTSQSAINRIEKGGRNDRAHRGCIGAANCEAKPGR